MSDFSGGGRGWKVPVANVGSKSRHDTRGSRDSKGGDKLEDKKKHNRGRRAPPMMTSHRDQVMQPAWENIIRMGRIEKRDKRRVESKVL